MQERAREEVISIFGNELNTLPSSDQLKVLNNYNHSVHIFYKSILYSKT
jgi:hypothetical protein